MSPAKAKTRRRLIRQKVLTILDSISTGRIDPYDGYRKLYLVWCSYNAAVPELKPLFCLPGVEPNGILSVTAEFRDQVRSLAGQILPLFSPQSPDEGSRPSDQR